MGIVIVYILYCIGAVISSLFYAFIMKQIYKSNQGHFYGFYWFVWIIFIFYCLRLSFPWTVNFIYQQSYLLIPFALSLLISFHATFRGVRHYKKFFLAFLIVLISIPPYLSVKKENDKMAAEFFFFNNFPNVYYASPQHLDNKYFHFITQEEMSFNPSVQEKEFFNLETGNINPILVPNIVNLQKASFNFETNIVYVDNNVYTLKDNEIYVLECDDILREEGLQNLFIRKKVLCMTEYSKYPHMSGHMSGFKNKKFQNIINHYSPQNLPSGSGFILKFLLNVKPYMYNKSAEILEEDLLFADTVFLYQMPNRSPLEYYNPKQGKKNFCPVALGRYGGKCIEFRKLFIPSDNAN